MEPIGPMLAPPRHDDAVVGWCSGKQIAGHTRAVADGHCAACSDLADRRQAEDLGAEHRRNDRGDQRDQPLGE